MEGVGGRVPPHAGRYMIGHTPICLWLGVLSPFGQKYTNIAFEPIGAPNSGVSGFAGHCRSENPVMFHLNRLLASLGLH